MSGVQLRRYQLRAGTTDAFLDAWRAAMEVRSAYGFVVAAAVVDRDVEQFVWIVRHDGDFAAAEQEYYDSPERAALPVDPATFLVDKWVTMVEPELLP
jgi:hypothetical protein